jgi:hypothetical protein
MAGIRESVATETLLFVVDSETLAEECQDVLRKVGKVKNVSRETGVISGKVGFLGSTMIVLRISKKDNSTELRIQTNRGEGIHTSNGAQKGMMQFTEALGKDGRLKGKSAAAW